MEHIKMQGVQLLLLHIFINSLSAIQEGAFELSHHLKHSLIRNLKKKQKYVILFLIQYFMQISLLLILKKLRKRQDYCDMVMVAV